MIRIPHIIAILIAVTFSTPAWAASNNCSYQQQQVNYAQQSVFQAQNNLKAQEANFYRTQDQLADRWLIMKAQVDQYNYEAQLVRSYPASQYGFCWGWNVWGLIQCGIARNNRRNAAIRNADYRAYQAQARLENFTRYGQRLLERQAQQIVVARELVEYRKRQLDQANAALAQCQAG